MRPHLLRVTAFGAFGGTAEVPFGALSDAGLFLLHGETGAGKTTLLDAIGFALYGRVPGERNKTKRLRSDHASAADRTEVMFETTIGDRHLRITRRPQQVRPKLHGPGDDQRARQDPAGGGARRPWHTVSTRAKEADDEIADAMGMSAEQFFQVVLLPQGQFARFLHADADERRALLQKLFRTDRFRTVEDWLAERRRATRDRVQEADQALATLAARIAQVAGVPVPGDEPPPGPAEPAGAQSVAQSVAPAGTLPGLAPGEDSAAAAPQPTAAWADALTADAESARAEAAQAAGRAAASWTTPAPPRPAPASWPDRQNRRAALLARRDQLQAAGAQRTAVRRELDAAGRAAEIAKVLDDAERTSAGLVRAREAEARARAAAAAAGLPGTAVAADFRAAEQRQRQRVGRLEACARWPDRPMPRTGWPMEPVVAPRIARRRSRPRSGPWRTCAPGRRS